MDKKDERILKYLMDYGREKISTIARNLDIPRVTVYEHIQNMIKNGIIKKFTVIPDYKKLGLPIVAFIFVSFNSKEEITQRELAKEIAKIRDIEAVHIIAGEWDLLLKVRAASIEDVGNLVLDKLRQMKGIDKTQTITVFSTIKQYY